MKQATMHDTPNSGSTLFENVRPTIVVGEGASENTFSHSLTAEASIPKVGNMDVPVLSSNEFEDQFLSYIVPVSFPGL